MSVRADCLKSLLSWDVWRQKSKAARKDRDLTGMSVAWNLCCDVARFLAPFCSSSSWLTNKASAFGLKTSKLGSGTLGTGGVCFAALLDGASLKTWLGCWTLCCLLQLTCWWKLSVNTTSIAFDGMGVTLTNESFLVRIEVVNALAWYGTRTLFTVGLAFSFVESKSDLSRDLM